MKILITGANGFLGQHLTLFLAERHHDIMAVSRGESRIPPKESFQYTSLDLTDQEAVSNCIATFVPQVIIHTAAMSKPDECHTNQERCILQNITTTKYLLKAAEQLSQPSFIYISTDFVFGEDGPHSEDDAKDPLNFYGESKWQSEQLVAQSGLNYAIVRPVFIYGETWDGLRPSFLHWIKNSLSQQKPIKVVSDQQRTPTFVMDICRGIDKIITLQKTGVYHLAGKDILSPYEMATATAETLGLDAALIEKVTSDTFIEPVKRAKKSGLKIDKAIQELEYDPVDFRDGIRHTFNIV